MKNSLLLAGLVLPFFFAINANAGSVTEVNTGKWPSQTQPRQTLQQPPQQNPQLAPRPQSQNKNKNVAAYIGIGVDILPQSVVAQMPPGISTGEGIIITRFADDSAAKKSGLLAHDILLSYDNTKLIHPKQFIQLVRKDQPGRIVKLKVLRNGKVITHSVTLGMQEVPQARNGLVIKQLGENLYQANIRFTDASGKQQLRQYKGTREQIYNQALHARDLPLKDREQILFAAGGGKKGKSNNSWGSFMPFGNKGNGNNSWGSFMPFGNKNNGNNNSWGSFMPF